MNKHVKLIAALALALLLPAGVFGGCASEGTSGSGQATSSFSRSGDAGRGETVQLRIQVDDSLERALSELEQLYAETHEGVAFETVVSSAEDASASGSSSGTEASAASRDSSASASSSASSVASSSSSVVSTTSLGSFAKKASTQGADIVIAAGKDQMDDLEQASQVDGATRFDLATDSLVIVAASTNEKIDTCTLEEIASGAYRFALGGEGVYSGDSARQALSSAGGYTDSTDATGRDALGTGGSYSSVLLEGRTVSEKTNTDAVCQAVTQGECDVALVYASDVYRFSSLKVVGVVDGETYRTVVYPAAITTSSNEPEAADAFLGWCANDASAREILQKYGLNW